MENKHHKKLTLSLFALPIAFFINTQSAHAEEVKSEVPKTEENTTTTTLTETSSDSVEDLNNHTTQDHKLSTENEYNRNNTPESESLVKEEKNTNIDTQLGTTVIPMQPLENQNTNVTTNNLNTTINNKDSKEPANTWYNRLSNKYQDIKSKLSTAHSVYNIYKKNQRIIDSTVNFLADKGVRLKDTKQKLDEYPELQAQSTWKEKVSFPFQYAYTGGKNTLTSLSNTLNGYYNTYQTFTTLYDWYSKNPKAVNAAIQVAKAAQTAKDTLSSLIGGFFSSK